MNRVRFGFLVSLCVVSQLVSASYAAEQHVYMPGSVLAQDTQLQSLAFKVFEELEVAGTEYSDVAYKLHNLIDWMALKGGRPPKNFKQQCLQFKKELALVPLEKDIQASVLQLIDKASRKRVGLSATAKWGIGLGSAAAFMALAAVVARVQVWRLNFGPNGSLFGPEDAAFEPCAIELGVIPTQPVASIVAHGAQSAQHVITVPLLPPAENMHGNGAAAGVVDGRQLSEGYRRHPTENEQIRQKCEAYLAGGGAINLPIAANDLTPLEYAAKSADFAFVDRLLDQGAYINLDLVFAECLAAIRDEEVCWVSRFRNNKGPLAMAINNYSIPMVQHLLAKGAGVDTMVLRNVNYDVYHHLHPDVKEMITMLLGRCSNKRGAFFVCIEKQYREGLEKLLSEGSDVNGVDYHGSTPLIHAVDQGYSEQRLSIVLFLLDHGADVNFVIAGPYCTTALHRALGSKDLALIELLLSRGARSDIPNADGFTVNQLVEQNRSQQFKTWFQTQLRYSALRKGWMGTVMRVANSRTSSTRTDESTQYGPVGSVQAAERAAELERLAASDAITDDGF